jgi:hypothetical protein
MDKVGRGMRHEHWCGTRKAPSKVFGDRAHQIGVATLRWRRSFVPAALRWRRRPPVVFSGPEGILRLR